MRVISSLLSIIIPVYNVEKYVEDCIKSILNQTYKDLEIIIIDDGSTDNSYGICERIKEGDNRINVFHQNNMGVSSARNYGIKVCTGEYITFVDPDDTIELNMYETLMKEFNDDIDIVVCNYSRIEKNIYGDYTKLNVNQEIEGIFSIEKALVIIQSNHGYKGFVCNKIFKRGALLRNNKLIEFDTNLRIMEDNVFSTAAILNSKNVKFINKPFYNYFFRNGSATTKYKSEEKIEAFKILLDIINENYKEVINIIKWNLYTDYIYAMAFKYMYNNQDVYSNLEEIAKLRMKFIKGKAISKKGLVRKLIIEYGIRFKINKNIIEKVLNLNNK